VAPKLPHSAASTEGADLVLDCRGQLCPMPVVLVGRQIRRLEPGQVLLVLTTDRGTATDIPAWAADTGNEVLRWHEAGGELVFHIRRGAGEG
jgi:tRNA 2-thiouridine synthesizing protein A